MARIEPFAALRPRPELAGQICEPPYDVLSSAEARDLAQGNAFSFLHVSKPEIDLAPEVDPYSMQVYDKGASNFADLISRGALRQDAQPCFYLYRQIMGKHTQIGLVAAASCEDYLQNVIKKHEFTRPDKEDDRVRHIEALNSQTGPVFLVYRAVQKIDAFVQKKTAELPDTDFVARDGIRHSSWTIRSETEIALLRQEFAQIPCLYIADGHHRSAAAARVFKARQGSGRSGHFLSVIFPHNQMQILPYNRVLKDLNGLTSAELLEQLGAVFTVEKTGQSQPGGKHVLALYLDRAWYTLRFQAHMTQSDRAVERLDVSLLQQHVLEPILGIEDPRTSKRINFVGGIRGTAELEKLVNSGEYACAISMFPTSIEDLMLIADAGGIMPPKSTWFEPKLRDGMFCHLI